VVSAGIKNRFSGRKVFLTGHTGFKGAWLAVWLESLGADVTGFALAPYDVRGNLFKSAGLAKRLKHIEGDLRDMDAVSKALQQSDADIVFHLAAQPIVIDSYTDPVGTFASNAMGTAHVLEAVRKSGHVKTVIAVTSDKCYENNEQGRAFLESDPLGGHDPYSASKAATEIVVHSYRRSFLEPAGIKCATVRAGNVIGGGDFAPHRVIPDIVEAIGKNEPVVLRNPRAVRPWQHVMDALHGYMLLADALEAGVKVQSAYNFGPAEDEPVMDVEALVKAFISRMGQGSYQIEQNANAPHEAKMLRLDPRAAMRDLSWTPKYSAEQAAAVSAAWYKAFVDGGNAYDLVRADLDRFQA